MVKVEISDQSQLDHSRAISEMIGEICFPINIKVLVPETLSIKMLSVSKMFIFEDS